MVSQKLARKVFNPDTAPQTVVCLLLDDANQVSDLTSELQKFGARVTDDLEDPGLTVFVVEDWGSGGTGSDIVKTLRRTKDLSARVPYVS